VGIESADEPKQTDQSIDIEREDDSTVTELANIAKIVIASGDTVARTAAS